MKTWLGVSEGVVKMGVGGSLGGSTSSKPDSGPCSMIDSRKVLVDSHELPCECGGVYKLSIVQSMKLPEGGYHAVSLSSPRAVRQTQKV